MPGEIHQGEDGKAIGPQAVRAPQFGQVHNGCPLGDGGTQLLQQAFARHHGATGGDQVVDQQHPVTGFNSISTSIKP